MTPQEEQIERLVFEEKQRLSELPFFQRDAAPAEYGVLLSDRIEYYCGPNFQLISPFTKKFLRPAGYDLRVGNNYTKDGKPYALNSGGYLTIDPYEVAIIQTLETLNLPDFLIGRWNIRVGLAYQGLLWVGGAQVDPGFRGRLSCPIYNLSTQQKRFEHGDTLAMIDFVTTTPFKITATSAEEGSQAFQWWRRDKKLVFQQYHTELRSGVARQLQEINKNLGQSKSETGQQLEAASKKTEQQLTDVRKDFSQNIDHVRAQVDTFATRVFTVVAVLFTALGIVATKGSDQLYFLSSPVWVAAIALYFALRAHFEIHPQIGKWYTRLVPGVVALVVTFLFVIASLFFDAHQGHVSTVELQKAKEQTSNAIGALTQQKKDFETQIRDLRQQSDAKLANLQQEINLIRQKQVSQK